MEHLKKLIQLCIEHKVNFGNYEIVKNYIHINNFYYFKRYNDILKKIKIGVEEYHDSDLKFDLDSGKVILRSWMEDHHNGNWHDFKEKELIITDEERNEIIRELKKVYAGILKSVLKEEIIKELTDKRYEELMSDKKI